MLTLKAKERKYGRQSLVPYLSLGLISLISFGFTKAVTVPVKPENTLSPVLSGSSNVIEKKVVQQAILHWMKKNSGMPERMLAKIYSVAMENAYNDLILAICVVESNFNPHVESSKGAIGLMGVMPDVWLEELQTHGIANSREDLFTISPNIEAGAYVLKRYLEKTGNLKEALRRYSGGDPYYAGKVLRMLGEINITRNSPQKFYLALLVLEGPNGKKDMLE